METAAARFFRSIRQRRVAFAGIGVTNTNTIKLFARQGVPTTACDRRTREELGDVAVHLEELGVTLRLGERYLEGLEADILFRTPGMNYDMPELTAFRQRGGVVTSEMEVFFDLCPCPIIGVTGSDGKTTTTTLIAEMLRAAGKRVHLGGNIGKALLPDIFDIDAADWAAVELSSFQLISMRRSPQIAVVTNVAPNHLDVHGTMEEYIQAKRNIFGHQNAFTATVLNADNDITLSFLPQVRGEARTFSMEGTVDNGAYLGSDGVLYRRARGGAPQAICGASDIRLPGRHNIANYLTAIAAVGDLVEPEQIRKIAQGFGGVEHRIEFVRELNGVRWYNDSIATSPTRAIAGLRSFDRKLIILAGGYDKKIPFGPLAPEMVERVKLLILSGPTADKIEAAVRADPCYREGCPTILRAGDLPQAVALAHREAQAGDIVSLSPACASFDAYPNFEARGRHFKELVRGL